MTAVDVASEPLLLATVAGPDHDRTSVHLDGGCSEQRTVADRWWGTLADVDCVVCRVAARNQILRRQEGRA